MILDVLQYTFLRSAATWRRTSSNWTPGSARAGRLVRAAARQDTIAYNAPLHPAARSIPTICRAHMNLGAQDKVMHLLYSESAAAQLGVLIDKSLARLDRFTKPMRDDMYSGMFDRLRVAHAAAPQCRLVLLLLLVNIDTTLQGELCLVHESERSANVRNMDTYKAAVFFPQLRDVVDAWLQDEARTCAGFVDDVRSAYLCS